jgi:hypothetical protein
MRWISGGKREPAGAEASAGSVEQNASLDVRATIRALPSLLDGASLPSGIVELVVEDLEAPTRQLFDIRDGRIAAIEPGSAVPWASIAGSPTAWALALGPERQLDGLLLTGDELLARRVLAALPASD